MRSSTPAALSWQVNKGIHITKRDLFYSDVKLFKDQKDSDAVLDDVACMVGCTRTATSTSFRTSSYTVLSSIPPRTRRVMCPTGDHAHLSNWCLQSDLMTNSRLQAPVSTSWPRTRALWSAGCSSRRTVRIGFFWLDIPTGDSVGSFVRARS